MKKFLNVFIIATLAVLLIAGPASATLRHFKAKVYSTDNTRNQLTEITSGITYKVLARGTDTSETLYSTKAFASKTNPVTATVFNTQDRIDFYCDPTDSANDLRVDIIVVNTSGGYTAVVEDFDPYTHSIVIDQRPNVSHTGMIWFSGTAIKTGNTDTGIDFEYDTLIEAVWFEVTTAGGGNDSLTIGLLSTETNGDDDGFIATGNLDTAEVPDTTLAKSGALLDDGTDFFPDGHMIVGADAVSLIYITTSDTTTIPAGYIFYRFTKLR